MGKFVFLSLIYILFILIELVPLFKQKEYKIFATYSGILCLAFVVQILSILDYSIKDVYVLLEKVKYLF